MAELKRKEEELTTADLAGRSEKPQLIRGGRREELQTIPDNRDPLQESSEDIDKPGPILQSRKSAEIEEQEPVREAASNPITATGPSPLFSETEIGESRSRWSNIQTAFVDEPRRAVEDADSLVASLMKKLAEGFASERERLEKQWDRGESVFTEDLRIALQRYRAFFDRLLKA